MDELVRQVDCYNPRPILFHGYLAPFFVLQAAVYYYFSQTSDDTTPSNNNETDATAPLTSNGNQLSAADRHSYEIGIIAVTVSIALQIVTYLFCHWSVDVKCWLNYSRCSNPHASRFARVTPTPHNGSTELVPLKRETINKKSYLYFVFQKAKYIWDEEIRNFVPIKFPCDHKISHYKEWKGYNDPAEIETVNQLYGRNELDMAIPEFKELFTERATAPFFVFQTFCVGLWCLDEYWYYALFTLFMLVTFEVVLVKHQLRNMQEIRRMGNQPSMMQAFRQGKWKPIRSDHLICGDLVSISRSEHNVPCDILLIRGSCIIDESTLTGESVPQMKEALEDVTDDERPLDENQDKLHILFGGTKVLQHTGAGKDPGCIGYVLRTGFNTSQGKLLRTILFGVKRVTANNFETFCFIMFLLFFAVISACHVWNKGVEDPKRSRYRLFYECTVIITSVVPPELPIELSLAVNTSLLSLSKLYIYCTEPFRIPFAGKVEFCCFDKTGTLTSNDLVVEGVAGVPSKPDGPDGPGAPLGNSIENNASHPADPRAPTSPAKRSSKPTAPTCSSLAAHPEVTTVDKCPQSTLQVLASCHSLAHLDEKLVGDPLEKRVLESISWNYSKSGVVTPKRGRSPPLKIHQRFHFNSTLKRMATIASYKLEMTNDNVYICTAKGAPEFMRPLMKSLPENYDQLYLEMSRLGARVLALGYRTLGQLSHQQLAELKREEVEKDLMFAGFLLVSCPLKPDSRDVSLELANSGHRLVMITGDGALTACHVARQLEFVTKEVLILTKVLIPEKDYENLRPNFCAPCKPDWGWITTDQKIRYTFHGSYIKGFYRLAEKFDLCLTGESLDFVLRLGRYPTYELVARVKVFARVSPKQKEKIITVLKRRGKTVLMCGDGTNDVGALKHADVGVALLSSSGSLPKLRQEARPGASATSLLAGDENSPPRPNNQQQVALAKRQQLAGGKSTPAKVSPSNDHASNRVLTPEERRRQKVLEAQAKLKEILAEKDGPQFVKLGDASIAAPFTSRLSSTQCISHIIKQGRCTLVTTIQMFEILALNALLSAYCHSVLYLDGIKFSDGQFTLQGMLSTLCFLFITRSQPLKKLSARRPLPNIFNLYTILTVTLQFGVHFSSLVFLYSQARGLQESLDKENNATLPLEPASPTTTLAPSTSTVPPSESESAEGLHTEFKPSLVNSTVYIIWLSVQVATFVVNYKGHPFMQNLRSNRPLCYSFIGSVFVIFVCVNGWSPSLTEQMSIVEFPDTFRPILLGVIVIDFVLAYLVDRACDYKFGRLKLEEIPDPCPRLNTPCPKTPSPEELEEERRELERDAKLSIEERGARMRMRSQRGK